MTILYLTTLIVCLLIGATVIAVGAKYIIDGIKMDKPEPTGYNGEDLNES